MCISIFSAPWNVLTFLFLTFLLFLSPSVSYPSLFLPSYSLSSWLAHSHTQFLLYLIFSPHPLNPLLTFLISFLLIQSLTLSHTLLTLLLSLLLLRSHYFTSTPIHKLTLHHFLHHFSNSCSFSTSSHHLTFLHALSIISFTNRSRI